MRNKQETQDRESRVNTLMAENVKPSRGAEEARRDVVSAISELEAIFGRKLL